MSDENPVRLVCVENDGKKYLSFVVFQLARENLVVYSRSNGIESHEVIAQYARDEDLVAEGDTPVSGGVFDMRTGEFVRSSYSFGSPDHTLREQIRDRM